MASIQKRKNKNGTSHWRAVVRIKGYPTVCNHFDRKQEAEDWAADIERQIKHGQYQFNRHIEQHTFQQLIERYVNDGALQHIRSAEDVMHHLNYWKSRIGDYALIHLTTDLIGKERQQLADTPTSKGLKRSAATTNRYISSLSAIFSYAQRLKWVDENPCFNLTKLKENKGRDRVLSEDEISSRLLPACRQSKSPYLYCIVLMSLTTGARQGKILGLEWRHVDFENRLAYLKETKKRKPKKYFLSRTCH
ncbi:MAG: tyrosine-type recombinase/integrase [Parachlamydiales bacterium]|jgi:integrase